MVIDLSNSFKDKKVLITGGLGFIGSNLTHRCLGLGAHVTVYDCLDPNSGGNLYNVNDIKNDIEFARYDILNFERVCDYIAQHDILFNCAASTSHPYSMKNPSENLEVNGQGILNLLEAARRYNPEIKFIHIGTSTQLGPLKTKPADESHPEFPLDIYSANKSLSEKFVLIYANSHDMRGSVIRLPNVFGPRARINSSDFNFLNYFIGLALQSQNIKIFGDGMQMRNVLYIDDAIEALILAALSDEINRQSLFAVSDEHLSIVDIARTVIHEIGDGFLVQVDWPKERKAIEVGDAIISNKKIKSTLNWSTKDNLISGLKKTKGYFDTCITHYI